jgi:hypothetical protein
LGRRCMNKKHLVKEYQLFGFEEIHADQESWMCATRGGALCFDSFRCQRQMEGKSLKFTFKAEDSTPTSACRPQCSCH